MCNARVRSMFAAKTSAAILLMTAAILAFLAPAPARGQFADELVLALGLSSELLAPPALVTQIADELAAVRQAYPIVVDIHARGTSVPGQIMIRLSDDAWALYLDGLFTELEDLNDQYGVDSVYEFTTIPFLALYFELPYNSPVLADIYGQVDGIVYAEAGSAVGDGDNITTDGAGFYTFKHGWGDCPSGCLNEHHWEFNVSGDTVTLLSEYGDIVGIGASTWGAVKTLYR